MANLTDLALLRLYIDDRETGPTVFDDPELQDLLAESDDVHEAAAKAWGIKAARVHQWYQATVDGAFLSRDQVFQHCLSMVKFHEARSTGSATIVSVKMDSSFIDEDEEAEFG